MHSIGQFFAFMGPLVLMALIVWWVVSSLGRITRGIEDIAMTLRRMEHNGTRLTQ